MISAREAKRITDGASKKVLDDIDERVQTYAASGLYEYSTLYDLDQSVVDSVMNTLKECGYCVEAERIPSPTSRHRFRLTIKWNNPEETA